jgi:hypothetical protein
MAMRQWHPSFWSCIRGGRIADIPACSGASLAADLAVKQLGMEGTVVGKRLWVSQSAISRAVERGEALAAELSITLQWDKNA